MNSMARIIKSHNSKLSPRHQCPAPAKGYNCRTKAECPLDGACREYNLVYQVTNAETQEAKIYIGMTEKEFKTCFNNHKTSFKHIRNIRPRQPFHSTSGTSKKRTLIILKTTEQRKHDM
jgi:hypothetical protein